MALIVRTAPNSWRSRRDRALRPAHHAGELHLTADEIGYIVRDCEAKAVFAEARVATAAAAVAAGSDLAVKSRSGRHPGLETYDRALAAFDGSDIDDRCSAIR